MAFGICVFISLVVLAVLQYLHMGEIRELHQRLDHLESQVQVTVNLSADDLLFPEQILAGLDRIEHRR